MERQNLDGHFEYQGKEIGYLFTEDNRPIKKVRGVEMMSRFVSFYDENGSEIWTQSVYDTFDKMSNLTPFDIQEWYVKYVVNRK